MSKVCQSQQYNNNEIIGSYYTAARHPNSHLIGDECRCQRKDLIDLLCGGDMGLIFDGVLDEEDGDGPPPLEVEL